MGLNIRCGFDAAQLRRLPAHRHRRLRGQADDKQALLLSLWLVLMASAFTLPQPFEGMAWWYRALIVLGQVSKVFAPTFLLHLFLVFPEPSPILKRWPRLERYLYVPTL